MNSLALSTLNQMTATGCMGDGTGLLIGFAVVAEVAVMFLAALFLGIVLAFRAQGRRAILAWVLLLPGTVLAAAVEGGILVSLLNPLELFAPLVGLVPIIATVVAAALGLTSQPPNGTQSGRVASPPRSRRSDPRGSIPPCSPAPPW